MFLYWQQYATVSLVMQDKGHHKELPLEVTRGEIRVGEELNDFQFVLREYFFTCYSVGVIFLYTMQLTGLLLLRTYWKERQRAHILRQMRGVQEEDPSENLELDESQLEPDTLGEQGTSSSNNDWEDLPQQHAAPGNSSSEVGVGDQPTDDQDQSPLYLPIPVQIEADGDQDAA
jgi:hypothetical protein